MARAMNAEEAHYRIRSKLAGGRQMRGGRAREAASGRIVSPLEPVDAERKAEIESLKDASKRE